MNEHEIGNCKHYAWAEKGAVCIVNDDDNHYVTEFNTREELDAFITELNEAADKAFGR